jgi:hypothetical protein
VIGGHLDSWDLASGAIDNGIGSFAVLEIARVFQALGLKPRRTIQFVMFMGEEQGLLGSEALVRQMTKDGSLKDVRYMINLDMAGNPTGFNVAGREEMIPFFTEAGRLMSRLRHRVQKHRHQPGRPAQRPPELHAPGHSRGRPREQPRPVGVRLLPRRLRPLQTRQQTPPRQLLCASRPCCSTPWPTPTRCPPGAHRRADRDFLMRNQLKDELVLGQKWRWAQ